MNEKIFEQIRFLFAQKICDDMKSQALERTNEILNKLGITADVTIEIKCNSVDFEQFDRGLKAMWQEIGDANAEKADFDENIKTYKE